MLSHDNFNLPVSAVFIGIDGPVAMRVSVTAHGRIGGAPVAIGTTITTGTSVHGSAVAVMAIALLVGVRRHGTGSSGLLCRTRGPCAPIVRTILRLTDDPMIMFGMLEIVLRRNPVPGGIRVTR